VVPEKQGKIPVDGNLRKRFHPAAIPISAQSGRIFKYAGGGIWIFRSSIEMRDSTIALVKSVRRNRYRPDGQYRSDGSQADLNS
jgi:hypothetical protein